MIKSDFKNLIKSSIEDHNKSLAYVHSENFEKKFEEIVNIIFKSINSGGTIYTCGNGGSFSDALHFTAELIVRYKRDRYPISSLTLGSNQSNLTACSNDYNFEEVFLREYRAFSKKEDTLIAISTSGNSKNIIQIINYANSKNYNWILLTSDKLRTRPEGGIIIEFPFTSTAAVQECHIFFLQLICRALDFLILGDEY
tara:strand:- start:2077 stop:2670 length:594 start_codon:yes stop_codon:yes gene_type:complete